MFRWFFLISLLAGSAVHAEPLSFDVALDIAVRAAPDAVVEQANIDAAQAAARAAGRLPDPKLAVGIENLPVTGEDQWSLTRDFMTMRKIGVLQDVPNRGKRRAEIDIAAAAIAKSEAERRVRLLAIRRDAAVAWLNRYYLERRGYTATRRNGEDLKQLRLVARDSQDAGTLFSLSPPGRGLG